MLLRGREDDPGRRWTTPVSRYRAWRLATASPAINGSNLLTAISALLLHDAERWIQQAEIAAAMSLEALLANMKPYTSRLHELRGFAGAVTSAANLSQVLAGSDLITGKVEVKVQDAYSMRSTPQVVGALRIRWRSPANRWRSN